MKGQQAYCEPFHIEKSQQFEIHKVEYSEQDPYSCQMHFHEVHELIIFETVMGHYYYGQGESILQNNDLVFTPSLETHNFDCAEGAKSWYILQFLPQLFEAEDMQDISEKFAHGVHLRLPEKHIAIVQQYAHGLQLCYQQDAHSALALSMLKTLILWVAEYAEILNAPNSTPIARSRDYDKLKPIMDMFRHNTCVELSLKEAANKCFISQAHFSRMFKRVFRYSYSEYSLKHKLYSSVRLISQTDKSITEISYELNFSSPSHFIAQFKKQFLMTPKKYRSELEV